MRLPPRAHALDRPCTTRASDVLLKGAGVRHANINCGATADQAFALYRSAT